MSKLGIVTASCLLFLIDAGAGATRGATLEYSTYFGGSDYDGANTVAVDSAGNIYVAGATSSPDFPTLNPFQPIFGGGGMDGFLAKFDPSGQLLFSTYLGGGGDDIINAIKLDSKGNIIAVGTSHSTDLPATDDAFQPDYGGGTAAGSGDGFIAKFSSDGAQLQYCSYFGGSGDEDLYSLAIDLDGNVCIAGWTTSKDLHLKNAFQAHFGGGDEGNEDAFVAKFDATLTNLVFSTYFGGDLRELSSQVAVDPFGFVYLSGMTSSTNFPVTPGAFQTRHGFDPAIGPNWDGYVAKLKPDGSELVYFTYIGGPAGDGVYSMTVDAQGSAYLTGTIATQWPNGTVPMGFQPTLADSKGDAWVAKLSQDGSNLAWFSYLGGTGTDFGLDIILDKDNNVYVGGITESTDFPVVDAVQSKSGGAGRDSFVAKVSPDGRKLIYSTFLGGSAEDSGAFLALNPEGNLIAVGQTSSENFPIHNGIQTTNASTASSQYPDDAFIVTLSPAVMGPPLDIARSGANVLVSWSTNYPGFLLESADSISSIPSWNKVSTTPLTLSGQFVVVQRSAATSQFFRLRRPP